MVWCNICFSLIHLMIEIWPLTFHKSIKVWWWGWRTITCMLHIYTLFLDGNIMFIQQIFATKRSGRQGYFVKASLEFKIPPPLMKNRKANSNRNTNTDKDTNANAKYKIFGQREYFIKACVEYGSLLHFTAFILWYKIQLQMQIQIHIEIQNIWLAGIFCRSRCM